MGQVGGLAEVVEFEEVGTALGAGLDDLGGEDFGEPLIVEELPESADERGLDLEGGAGLLPPQGDVTVGEQGFGLARQVSLGISTGGDFSEGAMTSRPSAWTSKPPGAFSLFTTLPRARTTDSCKGSLPPPGSTTCTTPLRSRTSAKRTPPRSRRQWSQPNTSTS